MKNMYNFSFKMNPSDIYRERFPSISSEQLFSAKRDPAGQLKMVYKNIKHEALHEKNSFNNIRKNLSTFQENLKRKTKPNALLKDSPLEKSLAFCN